MVTLESSVREARNLTIIFHRKIPIIFLSPTKRGIHHSLITFLSGGTITAVHRYNIFIILSFAQKMQCKES